MKKLRLIPVFLLGLLAGMAACSDDNPVVPEPDPVPAPTPDPDPDPAPAEEWVSTVASPVEWDGEKRADISYQLLVYSFADSDGDKYGDLNGVTAKLDYIQSLGANAIWLSPIHPADSYHGYDVTDYTAVNPQYGTMNDFKRLLDEAHARGIKVYLDYVLNHTGKGHPWFTEAVADETSPYRDYYFFNTTGGSNYWEATSTASVSEGILKFTLDWGSTTKTVTVEQASVADTSEGTADLWLYYGNGSCKRFHDRGDNKYELTVDYASDWGFLIRTNNGDEWGNNTKYGASSADKQVTLGAPFTLYTNSSSEKVQNLTFAGSSTLYFYGVFGSWMPDLNYGAVASVGSNPTYQALLASAKGWIDAGVDGFRLDAVKHIYDNESDNPPFLKKWYDDLNAYYKSAGHADDIYMVGEALVDDANSIARYYEGLPAMFEFPFWYRLEWAINNSTGCYFANDILGYQQLYAAHRPGYIEATKLSNHDEDRAGLKLGKSEAKEKLAAAVLMTAAGAPYIYYGEELGFYGVAKDQYGDQHVREPMQWGDNMTTDYMDGISKSDVHSVAQQQADANSLLNVYVTFAKLRNSYPALAEGTMSAHAVYNNSNTTTGKPIAAWYMTKDSQKLLVVHNFGASAMEISLTDAIDKAVGVQGEVQQKTDGNALQVKMGAYSSVVFLLK